MRLPRGFTLPYGYKVKVRVVSKKQLDKVSGGGAVACWRGDLNTIYVLDTLSYDERWQKFSHEYEHCCTDYRLWLLQKAGVTG